MRYLIAILAAVLISFAAVVPVVRDAAFLISDKLPTLLAVLLAAVLVRLARGLPTIPFDKIKPAQALQATAAFRLLLQSYSQCLIVIAASIALNLFAKVFLGFQHSLLSLTVGGALLLLVDSLTVIIIYFLVSADIKISTIQADLMDQVTGASSVTSAEASASKVRDAFKTDRAPPPSVTPL